jgi:beta-lactam-binding protein with PASTA domain
MPASSPVAAVPNVVGTDIERARNLLEELGFRVSIEFRAGEHGWGGKVVAQHPPAGAEAWPSHRILLIAVTEP